MSDSTLYLYTSLTAGSSHIITATSRLETILKANKIPFRAIDVATDDAARKLWGRRSKGKKLPGLVKYGTVVGDLEQIEEWNEYGELKMQINNVEDFDSSLPATSTPIAPLAESATTTASAPAARPQLPTPKPSTIKIQDPPEKETQKDDSIAVALRQAGEQAAAKAKESTAIAKPVSSKPAAPAPEPQIASVTGEPKEGSGLQPVRRTSVAPEVPESGSRPPLVPEFAAESSANFRADNAEALGLINHHRNSNIVAESREEAERLAKELRKSISGVDNSANHKTNLQSLRDEKARLDSHDALDEALEA
ncbi:hypothetical protein ASPCAL05685 [Aspergillus calidoustus]|uniref:Uncharacterized protein n=1 Tax=Aspergillus calidoustus TaxID=454130 RepID=A0A0U5G0T2_ASPCI|nr:hypothetical protein ASPCAL05685 [Aspergillus calidoustus]